MQTYKEAEAAAAEQAEKDAEAQSSAPQQESETASEESDTSESTDAESHKDAAYEEEEESEDKDQSEDDDDDDDEEEDEKPRKPKKGKGRNISRRIKKLTQQRTAAQREAEYWREKAMRADRSEKTADETESKPPQNTAQAGKPDPDDYDSQAEWLEAVADWKAEAKLSEWEAKQQQKKAETEQQQKFEAHIERVQDFAKQHEDFENLMEDVDDIPLSRAVQQAFVDSENGPQLMYALAKDPEELERICKLSPEKAHRAIGRIEARLENQSTDTSQKVERKTTTKAPKPLKPVGAKSGKATAKSIYDPDISFADYERLRAKQSSF